MPKYGSKPEGSETDQLLVPNGTHLISPDVTGYVEQYKSFAKRTAESIIMLASIVVDAKMSLEPDDFTQFCHEVGLDQHGSTFRKLCKIGENATRFQPFLEQIPNNWTTIYQLAKLEPSEYNRIIDDGVLNPFTTASEVSDHIKERKQPVVKKSFTILATSLSKQQTNQLYKDLIKLKQTYKFDMTISNSLENEIDR